MIFRAAWWSLTSLLLVLPACSPMAPSDNANTNANDNATNDNSGGDDSPTSVQRIAFEPDMPFHAVASVVLATGDVTGDGLVDIVTATDQNPGRGSVVLHGNGGFGTAATTVLPGDGMRRVHQLVTAQIDDRDGLDVLVVNSGQEGGDPGGIFVLLNQGNTLALSPDGEIGLPFDRPSQGAVGDLNNDGLADIVVTDILEDPFTLAVLFGEGGGTMSGPQTLTLPDGVGGLTLADVDGDGNLDVVMSLTVDESGTGLNQGGVWYGTGMGTFDDLVRLNTRLLSGAVAVADLNGDGDLDVLIGDTFGTVNVFLATGPRRFADARFVEDAPGAEFNVGDMDQDGDVDIIAQLTLPVILLNDGTGNFPEIQMIEFNQLTTVSSISTADLDNDGRLDIATTGAFLDTSDLLNPRAFSVIVKLQE